MRSAFFFTSLLPLLASAAPACPSTVNTLPDVFSLYLSSANPKFNNVTLVFSPPSTDPHSPLQHAISPVLPIFGAAYPIFPLTLNNGVLSLTYQNEPWNAFGNGTVQGLKPAFEPVVFAKTSLDGANGGKGKGLDWSATVQCDGSIILNSGSSYQGLNVLINQLSGVPKGSPDAKDWPPVTVEILNPAAAVKKCGNTGVCGAPSPIASA